MTASQTGGKKGAWRAGRLFHSARVHHHEYKTSICRRQARDKPRPTAQGLCGLLYPRSRGFTSEPSLQLSLLFLFSTSPAHLNQALAATRCTLSTADTIAQ